MGRDALCRAFNSVFNPLFFHLFHCFTSCNISKTPAMNNGIYEFHCRCDATYVGRTSLRLEDRIKQHIPLEIQNNLETGRTQPSRTCKNPTRMPAQSDSAIGQHLPSNPECAQNYHAEWFQIVARAPTEAHLRVLEATFIHTRAPVLCKQTNKSLYKHSICSVLAPL